MGKQVYTTGEVARILGASVEAVNRWIKEGKLHAYSTPGGHHRIAREDIIEFSRRTGMWLDRSILTDALPRALIIDDEPAFLHFVAEALKKGFLVETATSSYEGLIKLGLHRPDVILFDYRMPNLNGYELVKVVKAQVSVWQPKLILMTAFPYEEDVERIREIGIDGFLAKPFSPQDLWKVLDSVDLEFDEHEIPEGAVIH